MKLRATSDTMDRLWDVMGKLRPNTKMVYIDAKDVRDVLMDHADLLDHLKVKEEGGEA